MSLPAAPRAPRPLWVQIPATLILTACATGIGAGLSDTIQPMQFTRTAAWLAASCAPVALAVAIVLWRSGRQAAWWFFTLTTAVYVTAGAISGAFAPGAWSRVIPIMRICPLLYPLAGLVWGGLMHQAATQGYLAFTTPASRTSAVV